jgi:hypothetical protein
MVIRAAVVPLGSVRSLPPHPMTAKAARSDGIIGRAADERTTMWYTGTDPSVKANCRWKLGAAGLRRIGRGSHQGDFDSD